MESGLSRAVIKGSPSPTPNKHRRSWQPSSSSGRDRPHPRSFSPHRGDGKKNFRFSPKVGGRRDSMLPRKSRSPRSHKRPRSLTPPVQNQPLSPSYFSPPRFTTAPEGNRAPSRSRMPVQSERPGSRFRQRSLSPRPPPRASGDRAKPESRYRKPSGSSEDRRNAKKKTLSRYDGPPPAKRSRSRSPQEVPLVTSSDKRVDSTTASLARHKVAAMTHRRVSSVGKAKTSHLTLHRRFTGEDQDPFELEENVTIAILRNPNAEPSEDVTVKRVFNASVFKMVHKKIEGRKPIFDREEIKIWRHDENLSEGPDFERRLVRVKSSSTSKPSTDKLSRLSPDIIRKAFGRQFEGARSRSPHREPEIRLDPRPDPRYETKFREQLKKEQESWVTAKGTEDTHSRGRMEDRRGKKEDSRSFRGRDDDRRGGRTDFGKKGETYDLRQALERRRSDRGEAGFRIEVMHGEGDPSAELFYRDSDRDASFDRRRQNTQDGRSIVLSRPHDRLGSVDRMGWNGDRRRGRGRGRGGRGVNRRQDWSPERQEENLRERSAERWPRRSTSPSNTKGRRGGHRGRGRGWDRDRDYGVYEQDIVSPTNTDVSYKYSQHDDRDVSPKPFRGRRFSRGFGSSGFRAISRGGFRSRGNFQQGAFRGRGFNKFSENRNIVDRRSVERERNLSLEREWKHDMFDSLQVEEAQPHSTTVGT